jgi:hypothetical protein
MAVSPEATKAQGLNLRGQVIERMYSLSCGFCRYNPQKHGKKRQNGNSPLARTMAPR